MEALIDMTNEVSSDLLENLNNITNEELVTLLTRKIEYFIDENRTIIVDISTPLINCRNTFSVEDYEIDEGYLYLNNGNFELHINFDKIEAKYNNFLEESFVFFYNDTEISIYFLE